MPFRVSTSDTKFSDVLKKFNDDLAEMRKKYEINWPIAMMQPMSQLPIDFGITTSRWTGQIPALVLIRPDGDVALIDVGCIDTCHIEKTIESLISGKPDEALK